MKQLFLATLMLMLLLLIYGTKDTSTKPVIGPAIPEFTLSGMKTQNNQTGYTQALEQYPDQIQTLTDQLDLYLPLENIPIELFESFYEILGPETLLYALDQLPYCHAGGHNLGKLIYQKNQNLPSSVQLCGTTCTLGCLHGAIAEFVGVEEAIDDSFTHATPKDFKPATLQTLNEACEQPYVDKANMYRAECYHGIGHGLAILYQYEITKALAACKELTNADTEACYSGVYMERDLIFGETDSKIAPLHPCSSESEFLNSCYKYKLRRTYNTYTSPTPEVATAEALKTCLSINNSTHRLACFYGLGDVLVPFTEKNFSLVIDTCRQGNDEEFRWCLMTPIRIHAKIDYEQTVQLCSMLPAVKYQSGCIQTANDVIRQYPDDI